MGIGDFIKKAKDLAGKNKDKVNQGIDKVGDIVDEKTDDKYADQVDKGQEVAKDFVEDLPEDD